MADVMLAALDGAVRFDPVELSTAAARAWPRAVYTPYAGQLAAAAAGQLELGDADGHALFVTFLDESGLGIEGDDALAARFLAWLAAEYRFPADGRVVVTDWAADVVSVAEGVTAGELLGLRPS